MRSHCYYNAQTGEIRESCYPKVETIAKECGVNPATIHRLIQRDKVTGEFVSKNAEALKRFMKVQPRWLYDPKVGHKYNDQASIWLHWMIPLCQKMNTWWRKKRPNLLPCSRWNKSGSSA